MKSREQDVDPTVDSIIRLRKTQASLMMNETRTVESLMTHVALVKIFGNPLIPSPTVKES